MKDERPIIFSGPMVKQILAGNKTQTRRPMKPQPDRIPEADREVCGDGWWWACSAVQSMVRLEDEALPHLSPYGGPKQHLWVRENWAADTRWDDVSPRDISRTDHQIWYQASFGNFPSDNTPKQRRALVGCGRWRPSIHMPRWASRITLEVTEVRTQRLQEIDCYDLRAEGFECPEHDFPGGCCISECSSLRERFVEAWNEMYRDKPDLQVPANPWVWAVKFKVLP